MKLITVASDKLRIEVIKYNCLNNEVPPFSFSEEIENKHCKNTCVKIVNKSENSHSKAHCKASDEGKYTENYFAALFCLFVQVNQYTRLTILTAD